jgi:LSD1 subclass zinc finger protein
MPVRIPCPSCQRHLHVPPGFHGRQVRCPNCKTVFVGDAGTEITAAPPQPGPRAPLAANRTANRVDLSPDYDGDDFLAGRRGGRGDRRYTPDAWQDYRSGATLALLARLFLFLEMLMSVVMLVSSYFELTLLQREAAGEIVPDDAFDANEMRQLVLAGAHLALMIPTVVFFVMWFYRAHANLEPLGARRLKYTPGWAAGSWFVPFLNLIRPAQIAQEIWRHSDPDAVLEDGTIEEATGNSTLIIFWWLFWLVCNIAANVSLRLGLDDNPQQQIGATVVAMIADATSIIASLFALAVVSVVHGRQEARYAALEEAAEGRSQIDN